MHRGVKNAEKTVSGQQAHFEEDICGLQDGLRLIESSHQVRLLSIGISYRSSVQQEKDKVKNHFEGNLSTGDLDLVAHLLQGFGDLLAVLALDLDHILPDGPAASTYLLQFLRKFL